MRGLVRLSEAGPTPFLHLIHVDNTRRKDNCPQDPLPIRRLSTLRFGGEVLDRFEAQNTGGSRNILKGGRRVTGGVGPYEGTLGNGSDSVLCLLSEGR